MKKQVPWNKELTKETDVRVAKQSETMKGHQVSDKVRYFFKNLNEGKSPWNKNLTKETDERVRKGANKTSKTRKRKMATGEIVPWNKRMETKTQTLCLCGCGEITNPGRMWIKGHHVRINNPMDNPESVDKLKGDLNPSKRPEVRKLISEKLTGYKHTEEAVKNMTKAQMERKEKDQEAWYDMSVKGGKNMHIYHPGLASEVYKKVALKAHDTRRKNSPYVWKGVNFLSNKEMECAKLLLSEPIDGVNCNIRINGKIIDFYLKDKNIFVEYHPWDWNGLTTEQYQQKRQQIIDNSEYKGTELIVITDLKEVKND